MDDCEFFDYHILENIVERGKKRTETTCAAGIDQMVVPKGVEENIPFSQNRRAVHSSIRVYTLKKACVSSQKRLQGP